MSEGTSKSFKVPKIRRNESKDNLRQIDPTCRDAQELSKVVQRSYLESNYGSPWDLKSVVLIENRELEERYRQKKQEMKEEGRRDLTDQYAFMLLRENAVAMNIAREGLRCRLMPYNGLGDSKFGVYLCRNADVQFRVADLWGVQACTMVIFKVTLGKCKVISGQGNDEKIEPTPNFDCHVSQYQPRPSDNRHLQMARSQVYLYEYTDECVPAGIPRQCLPYAILAFNKVESVTKSVSQPTDSYSKRPVPVTDKPKVSETPSGEAASDTSGNQIDQKGTVPKMETESGLCVPRLTAGPPPSSGPPISSDPSQNIYDPRLRPVDPRLQAGLESGYQPRFGPSEEEIENETEQEFVFPPQQKRVGLPPIDLPPVITDTRVTRIDPRLDPRLRTQSTVGPNPSSAVSSSVIPPGSYGKQVKSDDSNPGIKKKLSLTDYKKKVGVVPVEKAEPKSTASYQPARSGSIYDSLRPSFYISQPDYNSFQAPCNSDTPFSKPPPITPTVTAKSYDSVQSVTNKEETAADKYDPASPLEDVVDKPDDMMKTLNELSDPDDASQSPKVHEEVEEEDPCLAEAMKKLVEYSGNVSLFTEALRSLQESAEELGDTLTDPEFLVKKIAETIDSLAKSESSNTQNDDPVKIAGTDNVKQGLNAPATNSDKVDKFITENQFSAPVTPESPMTSAMKNTLAEWRQVEIAKDCFQGEIFPYLPNTTEKEKEVAVPMESVKINETPLPSRGDVKKKSKLKNSSDLEVSSIPLPTNHIPPGPVENSGKSVEFEKSQKNGKTDPSNHKPDLKVMEVSDVDKMGDKDDRQLFIETVKQPKSKPEQFTFPFDQNDRGKEEGIMSSTNVVELDRDYRDSSWKHDFKAQEASTHEFSVERMVNKQADLIEHPFNVADKSDSDVCLDKDERFYLHSTDSDNTSRGTYGKNQIADDEVFQDHDERRSHSRSLSPQTISSAFLDKDDRHFQKDKSNPEKNLNFNDPFGLGMEDRDDRLPIPRNDLSKQAPVVKSPEKKMNMNDPRLNRRDPRLKAAVDSTVTSLSTKSMYSQDNEDSNESPVLFDAYNLGKTSAPEKSNELQTEDKDMRVADNNFGDIDWRTAAATEMGDFDFRAAAAPPSSQGLPIDSQQDVAGTENSEDVDFRKSALVNQAGPEHSSNYNDTTYGNYSSTGADSNTDPRFDNQGDFYNQTGNGNPSLPHQAIAGSYNTNRLNYESYSSGPMASYNSSTQFGGEYKSSSMSGATYPAPYSYSSSSGPQNAYQSSAGPGLNNLPSCGIQNVMQNVDISSLKNILASVQLPAAPAVPPSSNTQVEDKPPPTDPATDSDDDKTDNQPAFCTGLSFLKSKQQKIDVTRPKYSGKAIVYDNVGPPPPKNKQNSSKGGQRPGVDRPGNSMGFNKGGPLLGMFPSLFGSRPMGSQGIPGLDIQEQKQKSDNQESSAPQPFTFSEEIPERDISSVSYQEQAFYSDGRINHKGHRYRDFDRKGEGDKNSDSTPKGRKKDDDDKDTNSTPRDECAAQSWQNAILESMEQSALKVRSEDSFISDIDTPVKESSSAKELFPSKDGDENSTNASVGVKRAHETDGEKRDNKLAKSDKSRNSMEPDSDDEEAALVIDLSPTAKKDFPSDNTHQHKSSVRAEEVEGTTLEVDNPDTAESTETEQNEQSQKQSQEEDEPGVDDEAEKKVDEAVLEDDDEIGSSTTIEMKSLMEKRRSKIVIKLKGQTKIVDPKTGKAYTDLKDVKGSAIEVLGQPPAKAPVQQKIDVVKRVQNIQGISTIGSGSKSNMPSAGGRGRFRTPSPVNQAFVSSGSADVSTGFRSVSPVNPISTVGQQPLQSHEYIHPYTGQKMVYGQSKQQNVQQPVPVMGQNPIVGRIGVSSVGNPNQKIPLLPSPPASSIGPPFVVVAGQPQRAGIPVLNVQQPILVPGVIAHSRPPVSQMQPNLPLQPVQQTGMAIQTLGTGNQNPTVVPVQEVKKEQSEKLGWSSNSFDTNDKFFSGNVTVNTEPNYVFSSNSANKVIKTGSQFGSNEASNNVTVKTDPNYEFSSNSAIKVIKTEPEYESNSRKNNIEVKIQHDNVVDRKRQGSEESECKPEMKRAKVDLPNSIPPTAQEKDNANDTEAIKSVKTKDGDSSKEVDTAASSELEDGEISDDSDDTNDYPAYKSNPGYTRYGSRGDSQPVQSISTVGSYPGPGDRYSNRPHRAASEWAELLQSPTKQPIERIKATHIESKSLMETSDLLSKSAASITKTKQKIIARSQVKTLGDWLKVELETDNIQPLQNIIPYSLNTDLSIIPKLRRRKIRVKVKNAIELVGNKKQIMESQQEEDEGSKQQLGKIDSPPEMDNGQVELEAAMLRKTLTHLKETVKGVLPNSTSLIGAFATVESEMRTLTQRTCFYGYPNRRVPKELLLESEMGSFVSDIDGTFLILMMPISSKPYFKLLQMKYDICKMHKDLETSSDPDAITASITELQTQRQNLLKSFTGYLNKRRIQRIQDQVEKYTTVYYYYKGLQPPLPDSKMKFIRTTQMDLRQHLILARQHLAIEEQRLEG